LEETELPDGVDLQISDAQHVFYYQYKSDEAFFQKLTSQAKFLKARKQNDMEQRFAELESRLSEKENKFVELENRLVEKEAANEGIIATLCLKIAGLEKRIAAELKEVFSPEPAKENKLVEIEKRAASDEGTIDELRVKIANFEKEFSAEQKEKKQTVPPGFTLLPLSKGVTKIPEKLFQDDNSLINVVIPYGVTSIGVSAFKNCLRLIRVNIPDSVTRIESHAFGSCFSLKNVTVPDSVIGMGVGVFSNCPNLTIHTPMGSYAEKYAAKNGIKVQAYTPPEWAAHLVGQKPA
jgi:uncharacterized coiled-coil protein SlyX